MLCCIRILTEQVPSYDPSSCNDLQYDAPYVVSAIIVNVYVVGFGQGSKIAASRCRVSPKSKFPQIHHYILLQMIASHEAI